MSCGLLTITLGKEAAAARTASLFLISAVEYMRERAGKRGGGGKNWLKIVSMWQRMIEFPGL